MWKGPCEIGLKWIVLESWKTLCRISSLKGTVQSSSRKQKWGKINLLCGSLGVNDEVLRGVPDTSHVMVHVLPALN
jgi:hypothetical protein